MNSFGLKLKFYIFLIVNIRRGRMLPVWVLIPPQVAETIIDFSTVACCHLTGYPLGGSLHHHLNCPGPLASGTSDAVV